MKNPPSINIYKMKYVEFLHISSNELKYLSKKQLALYNQKGIIEES